MMQNKMTFIPGSEWLYYKLYCGLKTTDLVLLEIVKPLVKNLSDEGIIDKWFFIRYSDPEPHLRIRFHIKEPSSIGTVLLKAHTYLTTFVVTKQIWEIQIATYNREVERYGVKTMDDIENFFCYDSYQTISLIENYKDEESRFIAVFKWCEFIISLFSFNDKARLSFLSDNAAQFKLEFKLENASKKQLSKKYRTFESELLEKQKLNIVSNKKIKKIIVKLIKMNDSNELEVVLKKLLASIIHMTINRSFNNNQRLYELMIYDFLFRKNKSNYIRYGKI